MNFIPDVRYDFQTPNIVTLAVKVVTSPPSLPPLLSDSIGYGYREDCSPEKGRIAACLHRVMSFFRRFLPLALSSTLD